MCWEPQKFLGKILLQANFGERTVDPCMAFITDSTGSIKREFLAVGFQSLQLPKRLQSLDLEANLDLATQNVA